MYWCINWSFLPHRKDYIYLGLIFSMISPDDYNKIWELADELATKESTNMILDRAEVKTWTDERRMKHIINMLKD